MGLISGSGRSPGEGLQEARRERPGEEGGLPLAVEPEAGIYGRGGSCRRTWRASAESGTSCKRA